LRLIRDAVAYLAIVPRPPAVELVRGGIYLQIDSRCEDVTMLPSFRLAMVAITLIAALGSHPASAQRGGRGGFVGPRGGAAFVGPRGGAFVGPRGGVFVRPGFNRGFVGPRFGFNRGFVGPRVFVGPGFVGAYPYPYPYYPYAYPYPYPPPYPYYPPY
jgi:hypothetical protein